MPTFFDLQKFAHTGIASPDMTAFDKARALAAFGGGKTRTLTDVPPLSFKANGKPLISWSMLGAGSQTGTPTPDAPIMPQFCGVRTGNLFDATTSVPGLINDNGDVASNVAYSTSEFIRLDAEFTISLISLYTESYRLIRCGYYTESKQHIANDSPTGFKDGYKALSFTPPDGTAYIRFSYITHAGYEDSNIMLNAGSTALHYEPYGYKIPITNAGQTVPVYLGQVPTVRRVKKLVLTGEEQWAGSSIAGNPWKRYVASLPTVAIDGSIQVALCTHYQYIYSTVDPGFNIGQAGTTIYFRTDFADDVTAWKAYLAQQYAAGTPVTVWYVLAESQTGIVNEPLAKIGDYADELHSEDTTVTIPTVKGENTLTVEGELPPSEMTITYKG